MRFSQVCNDCNDDFRSVLVVAGVWGLSCERQLESKETDLHLSFEIGHEVVHLHQRFGQCGVHRNATKVVRIRSRANLAPVRCTAAAKAYLLYQLADGEGGTVASSEWIGKGRY